MPSKRSSISITRRLSSTLSDDLVKTKKVRASMCAAHNLLVMTTLVHRGNAQPPRCLPPCAIVGGAVRSESRRPRMRLSSRPSTRSITRALASKACIQTINRPDDETIGEPSLIGSQALRAPPWLMSMAATVSVMFASPAHAAPDISSSMTPAQQSEACSSAGIEQAKGKLNVSQNVFNRAHRPILICEVMTIQL